MEEYLYDVSRVRRTQVLVYNMIEICKKCIYESVKNSTRLYFEENSFYAELPPNLQAKLVESILVGERNAFEYFF